MTWETWKTTKIIPFLMRKPQKKQMPDERLAIGAKVSQPADVALVSAFKTKLKKMKVEETGVLLDLVAAYMECVKRDKGSLPQPPYVLQSGPRD